MLTTFDRHTRIQVLYRDDDLIAVHKPSGMVVHPSDLARHEPVSLMGLVRRLARQKVWPIHRLDRPTSGIVLFALNKTAAGELGRQFQSHVTRKQYLALVRGIPSDQLIDYPLKELPLYRSDLLRSEPQEALTYLRLLDTVELPVAVGRYPTSRYSLVELNPVSGRRHQLRRHMKHISHPIIGDTTYGNGLHNRYFCDQFGCHRLLLAATLLTVVHPRTGASLNLTAPPDESFVNVLETIKINFLVYNRNPETSETG